MNGMVEKPVTAGPDDWREVLARIEAHPLEGTPADMRAAFEALTAGRRPPAEPLDLAGVPALAIGEGPQTLVWFHGGGGVFGSPESHLWMAAAIAAEGVRVVLPRYRLAPEHRWPAQLEDAGRALDALAATVPAGSVFAPAVGGASFGGHLALALALSRPAAVGALALLSPNTLRIAGSATREPLTVADLMNDDAGDAALADLLLGEADRRDPLVSPALAKVRAADFPAVHVEVGAAEILLDDSLLLVRSLAAQLVPVSVHVTAGTCHLEALWPAASTSGASQLSRIGRFVVTGEHP